jgi:hypothetical protein
MKTNLALTSHFPSLIFLKGHNTGHKPTSLRNWSRTLKNCYLRKCFISNKTELNGITLDSHHLKSRSTYPFYSYSLFNGIVLDTLLHKKFHFLYGLNAEPEQFLMFLDYCHEQGIMHPSLNVIELKAWVNRLMVELKLDKGRDFNV